LGLIYLDAVITVAQREDVRGTVKLHRFVKSLGNRIFRYPLPLAMALLTAATALLFYFEYQREEQRLIASNQTAFTERLNGLEMAVEQVVTYLALANNRAHHHWQASLAEARHRPGGIHFQYNAQGNYFYSIPDEQIPGNVFGSGKATNRTAHFTADLELAVDLLPWFQAAKEESDAIVQSYVVTATHICAAYPAIPPEAVLHLGNGDMSATFDRFYEIHKGRETNPQRQPYFLDAYMDRSGHGLMVTYARPVYDGDRFVGVIATDIGLGFLQNYTNTLGGLETRLMLIDQNGKVLADSERPEAPLEAFEQHMPEQLRGIRQDILRGKTPGKIDKFYVTADRLQNAPWSFIQIIEARVLSKRLLLSQITFSVGLLILVAFLSVTHFAIRKRRLESALQESELRYGEIFNATDDAIFIHDYATGKILAVNRAFEDMFGFTCEQAPNLQISDISYNEDSYRQIDAEQMIRRTLPEGPKTFKWKSRRKDGTLFWTEVSLRTTQIGGKHRTIAVVRDISERMQAENELRDKQETINAIVETSQDWIWMLDADGIHTYSNPAIETILGIPANDIIGRSVHHLLHPEDATLVSTKWPEWVAEKKGWNNVILRWRHSDGKYRFLESNSVSKLDEDGNLIGFLGVDRDITDRRLAETEKTKLENLLIQAQKMEAIGTLAGGIAHDFNNILGAIMGYAQLTEMEIPTEQAKAHDHIRQLLAASDRAKNLVSQILAFSRQNKPEKLPVDITNVVKDAFKLLRASLPTNIEIRQHYAPDLGTILADHNQIHQIIFNLCTNSFHAMEENGGLLEIALDSVELTPDEINLYNATRPGKYIKISVTDTGHGMDPATLNRIFEPYFTTKNIGEGTGLGLATVHGIVEDHGGVIKVYSEPGSGTTFHIFFPCIEDKASQYATTAAALPMGTEKVLFIDDEKVLIDIGEKMLTQLGYTVDCRTSPHEALEAIKANPEKYDLVISDMTMPKMTGDKLAVEILKIRRDLPIILCTGFSHMISHEKALALGIKDFLMKPLTIADLSQSIRKVLGRDKEIPK